MVMWDAPGPGFWELDRSHFLGGETPLVQYIQANSMPSGTAKSFRRARYTRRHSRLPVRQRVHVHTPATADRRRPSSEEPAAEVRSAKRSDAFIPNSAVAPRRPNVPRPNDRGERSSPIGSTAVAPLIESRNLAIQKVDLTELDDPTLIEHAQEVVEHCRASWEYHHWLHGYDLGPIGAFLAGCREWGVEPVDAIPLLEGASPSTVGPMHVLTQVAVSRGALGHRAAHARRRARHQLRGRTRSRQVPRIPRGDDDQPLRHRRCHARRDPRRRGVDDPQRCRTRRRRRSAAPHRGHPSARTRSPTKKSSTAGWKKRVRR